MEIAGFIPFLLDEVIVSTMLLFTNVA